MLIEIVADGFGVEAGTFENIAGVGLLVTHADHKEFDLALL